MSANRVENGRKMRKMAEKQESVKPSRIIERQKRV